VDDIVNVEKYRDNDEYKQISTTFVLIGYSKIIM
jgi:hypothetical protein